MVRSYYLDVRDGAVIIDVPEVALLFFRSKSVWPPYVLLKSGKVIPLTGASEEDLEGLFKALSTP